MSETTATERWFYAQLSGDATLTGVVGTKLYADIAPDESATPYVTYSMLSGVDLMVVSGIRIWTNMLYLVRGIDEARSYLGNLATIDTRIDAVLHKQTGSNVDGVIWSCVREQAFRLSEERDGRIFKHLGGIYRIRADRA